MQVSFHAATFTVIPAHLLSSVVICSQQQLIRTTLIMLRLATHTSHVPVFSSPAFSTPCKFGPAFSSPAISTPAFWSRVFQSCVFHSRLFSRPAVHAYAHIKSKRPEYTSRGHLCDSTAFLFTIIVVMLTAGVL